MKMKKSVNGEHLSDSSASIVKHFSSVLRISCEKCHAKLLMSYVFTGGVMGLTENIGCQNDIFCFHSFSV